jgi:hypothetical protein
MVDSSGFIRRPRSVAGLFFIGVLITGIGGVLIGLLGSTEGISTKTKDDFSPKRGNDQWWSWGS